MAHQSEPPPQWRVHNRFKSDYPFVYEHWNIHLPIPAQITLTIGQEVK